MTDETFFKMTRWFVRVFYAVVPFYLLLALIRWEAQFLLMAALLTPMGLLIKSGNDQYEANKAELERLKRLAELTDKDGV